MARKARERSATGIYYIRLDAKKTLFLDADDYSVFKEMIVKEKETDFLEIFAYCMIDSSAHLVLKEGLSGISDNVMHIKSKYAHYYNSKYFSVGSLFCGRFFSKGLEENADILSYVRETYRLPLKSGYKFNYIGSSYPLTFKAGTHLSNEIVRLFKSSADFQVYIEKDDENLCGGQSEKSHAIEELKEKIRLIFKDVDPAELEMLSDKENRLLIKRIKELTKESDENIALALGLDVEEIINV